MVALLIAVVAFIVVDIIQRYVMWWQTQKRIDSLVEYLEQNESITKAYTDHMLKLEEVMRGLQSALHIQEDKLVTTLRKKRKTSAD